MKILVVFCHPRRASLTGALADTVMIERARDLGGAFERC